MIVFLKFLAMWTLISLAVGLALGAVMRWSLHYEPPEPQPMYPLPSGSINNRETRA
jgi:hypothetical protein